MKCCRRLGNVSEFYGGFYGNYKWQMTTGGDGGGFTFGSWQEGPLKFLGQDLGRICAHSEAFRARLDPSGDLRMTTF